MAEQGFGGKADGDALKELAECLSIPLLASGDLVDARTGLDCLEKTGATGLMYARGALRNPAVFDEHLRLCRGEPPLPPDIVFLRHLVTRHIALIHEVGQEKACLWKMRNVLPRYVRGLPGSRALREKLCRSADWRAVEEALDGFWPTENVLPSRSVGHDA
jgi:tRNA-dihydrouridine synthase B